jgi:hypothetical protein
MESLLGNEVGRIDDGLDMPQPSAPLDPVQECSHGRSL